MDFASFTMLQFIVELISNCVILSYKDWNQHSIRRDDKYEYIKPGRLWN